MKKIIKLLVVNLVLIVITSFMCQAQSVDLFNAVKKYMDSTVLAAYQTALAANNADPNGMPEAGFLIEYTTNHTEFATAIKTATEKAMKELGITDPDDLVKALSDSIENLKKQIEANNKLLEEEKAAMEAKLQAYQNALNQMANQLAKASGAGGTPPQMQDIMQMIMQILQMLMGGGQK